MLDRLKRLCVGKDIPDVPCLRTRFDAATHQGKDMRAAQRSLAAAVTSIARNG